MEQILSDLIFELWDAILEQGHFTRIMMIGMFGVTWIWLGLITMLVQRRSE